MAYEGNGLMARLERAERDIEKLDREKAEAVDVQRLATEFASLRKTLQWFMGIVSLGTISFVTLIIQQLASQ